MDDHQHNWFSYDDAHRACLRCGLRVFMRGRGWQLVDYFGVPSPPLLTSGGGWGACRPPPAPPIEESVFIEYTGDPDVHPGCERIMHRFVGGSRAGLIDLKTVGPICGALTTWWELGPARDWPGWTWCLDCWVMIRGRRGRPLPDVHAELPPKPAPQLRAARKLLKR